MGKHSTAEPRRRSSASVRIPPARPALSRLGNNNNKHNEVNGQGDSFKPFQFLLTIAIELRSKCEFFLSHPPTSRVKRNVK